MIKFAALLAASFLALSASAQPSPPLGSVTLAWDRSPGTNVITNYAAYYGVKTRTYTNSVSAGTNLTATVTNLIRGQVYFFAATAKDIAGLESDYSSEVSTVIPPLPPSPASLRLIPTP